MYYWGYKLYDALNIWWYIHAEMHTSGYLIEIVADIPNIRDCFHFLGGEHNRGRLVHGSPIYKFARSEAALAGASLDIHIVGRWESHGYRPCPFLVCIEAWSSSLVPILSGHYFIVLSCWKAARQGFELFKTQPCHSTRRALLYLELWENCWFVEQSSQFTIRQLFMPSTIAHQNLTKGKKRRLFFSL